MNAFAGHNRRGSGIPPNEHLIAVRSHGHLAAPYVAACERQRAWQADFERDWLLHQSGLAPVSTASLVASLRQVIGAALVRVGWRLQGASSLARTPDSAAPPDALSATG